MTPSPYPWAAGFHPGDRPQVVTSRFQFEDAHTLERYHATGGYQGLRKALTMTPAEVSDEEAVFTEPLAAAWREKHESLRWQPEVVKAWLSSYGFQLKFVVAQAADVDEIEALLAPLGRDIPRAKVLLMPEGTTVEALRAKAGWLGELCKARGYRYALGGKGYYFWGVPNS